MASPRTSLCSLTSEAGGGSPWGKMKVIGTDDCGDGSHFENTFISKKDDKLISEITEKGGNY